METRMQKAHKALSGLIRKASRGTLSNYILNAPPEYGQPYITPGDAYGLISPERMREIVAKTPTVASCLNAISDYCSNVNILVKNKNSAIPADPGRVAVVENLLMIPNDDDTGRQLLEQLVYDLAVLGFAALEIEPNVYGKPAKLHVLDAARLKVDFDEHGKILGYDMLDAHGMPIHGRDGVHTWQPDEIIYFRRGAVSNSRYPLSRIHQLFSCAVLESMILAFVGGKFTEGNVPFGVYDLGNVSDLELKQAISHWNSQATSNHRIILTGSRGGSTWTEFGYALRDMDPGALLQEIRAMIMGTLGVTMNELGESQDVNKSNGYNLSYTFKRRAIEPLLKEIVTSLTRRLVHERLNFRDLECYFEEIDSRDELLQGQIDELYLKNGIYSPNLIANRKGLPSVPGGDDRLIIIGTNAIPLDLVRRFAEAQLQAIEAEVSALKKGDVQSGIRPPALRGPEPPRMSVPEGTGASAVHISYPKVTPNPNPQKPRGVVQAARNVGIRKEDSI